MRTKQEYLSMGISGLLVLGMIAFIYYMLIYTPTVKTGDVWRYEMGDAGNPYENVKLYDYKIMDVRNGYVKRLDLRDSTIDVVEQDRFKHYELVSRGGAILIYLPRKK